MKCNCAVVWNSLGLPFLGTGTKTDLFQSCGHCWVFQICWHIECITFTASSFRIWNSSTGISSPPLALFVLMLSKAHLTSHSRMSGSRWVITPLWLSGPWTKLRIKGFMFLSSWFSRESWVENVSGLNSLQSNSKESTKGNRWVKYSFSKLLIRRDESCYLLGGRGLARCWDGMKRTQAGRHNHR